MDGKKGVIESFQRFSKILNKYKDVTIDNFVFKLHYRMTVFILSGSTVLVTLQHYFGDYINCIADNGVSKRVINTFCFFSTTFTVARHFDRTSLKDKVVPHPGVGPLFESEEDEDNVTYHAYYQWVPFVLFLQGIMFYIPHYMWKHVEGGRLKALVVGLKNASLSNEEDIKLKHAVIPSLEKRRKRLKAIQDYFFERLHINRGWAVFLISFEILNAVNLFLQIFLLNLLFGGNFISLGFTVMSADFETEVDPLEFIFPKVTKCLFHKYGPTGTIQRHDAICVMSLNVLNEKIFTFLWFWLAFLTLATVLALLWRLLALLLHHRSDSFNAFVFRATSPETLDPWDLVKVTDECHFSDWLFLHYLGKNLEDSVFRELFLGIANQINENEKGEGYRYYGDEIQALHGE